MLDTYSLTTAIDLLRQAEVPKADRLWTTDRTVDLWDSRVPLIRDEWNADAAERTDAEHRGSLILCGQVGRGKTAWGTGHFNDLVIERVGKNENWGRHRCPIWVTEAALFRKAESASREGYHGRAIYLSSLIRAPILFLDDLGGNRRSLTDWQGGAMRDLFSERHSSMRPTLITTNLERWEDLEKRYGDHIVSRLIEDCGVMVRMHGPDRRRRAKAQ